MRNGITLILRAVAIAWLLIVVGQRASHPPADPFGTPDWFARLTMLFMLGLILSFIWAPQFARRRPGPAQGG
ncbi:MAG: hypothetical protein E6Q40_01005 [Cupriavidus sp.]|jgi:hypothetical protein|nr:hypothetical protein [Pseudomonadota bacterium]TXI90385.1 MAG: hypothetical protein E6Q40_01005 [Cupriavidus sp.]